MMKATLLGAAALLTAATAVPAMAQQAGQAPGAHPAGHRWSNQHNYHRRPSDVRPGDVAAGVVGGAIGTADAIATAPFRDGGAYAYYGDPSMRRGKASCGPQDWGTYLGPNGQWYPCVAPAQPQ